MKRNNLWNRIFHHKELKAQEKKYLEAQKLIGFGPETLQFIKRAQTLNDLLEAHKIAWKRNYRNKNLAPCEYGMFRTKDIANMTADEVYLGNIYGLWTFNITHWNNHTPSSAGLSVWGFKDGTTDVDLIIRQYRTLLRKNVEELIYDAKEYIRKYEM